MNDRNNIILVVILVLCMIAFFVLGFIVGGNNARYCEDNSYYEMDTEYAIAELLDRVSELEEAVYDEDCE